jgi:DegV family protein with EDD domain
MSKVGVLVCGNSGIDYIDHEFDIPVIRSILLFGEEEYTDFVDITADDFYKKLVDNPEVAPSTAQAATGVMMEQYEEMFNKGYDELFVIILSQHLSGTYAGAVMAANMLEGKKITVFDSKTVAYPEAKMALTAAEMFAKGKSVEEVTEELEFIRDNSMIWINVETLRFLVKNGRLSGAAGFVGSLMKIKPLLEVTKEGRVESIEKIRTTSKATERVIEKLLEEIDGKNVEVFLINTNNLERVQYISDAIKAKRPDLKEINVYPLTPVVGAHAGPGTVGVGYILKR